MARQPLEPPALSGYEYRSRLGSGGFADVFLYEREFPKQEVAIKVLDRTDDRDDGQDRFIAEANAMASVSGHPFIVTIFHADLAPDGHPYLVMEYYPGESFADRLSSHRFSVAEVLRLGVQVASAVETAHRVGILHRDIKPANILTSAYGRPGLTDFGIAATHDSLSEAEGLSIPWSPPEVVAGSTSSDERADVYSLAATLYTLLEGHSPFERPGERNRSIDLIDRIERGSPPPLERGDAPASLSRLLGHAMAKDPGSRPGSAAAFGRSLQAIEVEMRLDITPLELSEQDVPRVESIPLDAEAGSTRIKNPTVVSGQSSFQASADTIQRGSNPRIESRTSPEVQIDNVPFAIPSEQTMEPNRRTNEAPTPLAPTSASYLGTPRQPAMAVPGLDEKQVDGATWWRDRRNRTTRTVAISLAVIATAIVIIVAIIILGGSSGSSPHHALGSQGRALHDAAARLSIGGRVNDPWQ